MTGDDRVVPPRREIVVRRRDLVGLAAAALLMARPSQAAAAAPDDADVLIRLIAREEAAAFAHTRARAEHERDHAKALRTLLDALGRQAPPAPSAATELDGPARRLADATPDERTRATLALERALIAEYERALLELRDARILRTAGTILASHSQHHVLTRVGAGLDPFTRDP